MKTRKKHKRTWNVSDGMARFDTEGRLGFELEMAGKAAAIREGRFDAWLKLQNEYRRRG